jgi:hypothetical protein
VTFDEAMARIRRNGTAAVRLGEITVVWRFGRPVVATSPGTGPGRGERFIDYTPTRDDMVSTDWQEAQ